MKQNNPNVPSWDLICKRTGKPLGFRTHKMISRDGQTVEYDTYVDTYKNVSTNGGYRESRNEVPTKYNYRTEDPIVNSVLERIKQRSDAGMQRYGVTMARGDVITAEWLRHAQEEAMDLAIYLERCIRDLNAKS